MGVGLEPEAKGDAHHVVVREIHVRVFCHPHEVRIEIVRQGRAGAVESKRSQKSSVRNDPVPEGCSGSPPSRQGWARD